MQNSNIKWVKNKKKEKGKNIFSPKEVHKKLVSNNYLLELLKIATIAEEVANSNIKWVKHKEMTMKKKFLLKKRVQISSV